MMMSEKKIKRDKMKNRYSLTSFLYPNPKLEFSKISTKHTQLMNFTT
jgi:hypothetical protein